MKLKVGKQKTIIRIDLSLSIYYFRVAALGNKSKLRTLGTNEHANKLREKPFVCALILVSHLLSREILLFLLLWLKSIGIAYKSA